MTDAEWAMVRLLPVPGWMWGRGGQPEAYCHLAMLDAISWTTGDRLSNAGPVYLPVAPHRAECDRVGDGRADYSHKHRRHGVNVQVVTDPGGQLLWLSPALSGRTHDLTAARTHQIIRICQRQGVPILADLASQGAPWMTTGIKRRPP